MPSRLITCLLLMPLCGAAFAFSPDLGTEGAPAVPGIGPAVPPAGIQALESGAADPAAPSAGAAAPEEGGAEGMPQVFRSDADLPPAVRDMRARLIAAARSGEIEQLRALMEAQAQPPSVSLGDPGDPIEYLKALSSDAEGREILAILLEVLEAGFVRAQPGTADEIYVWPYFAQYSLEALTPSQLVELFTLLTAADYEEMRSYGAYTFFRVGIAPDGRWLFFLAGD
jgi:hypothetical protein